MSYRFEGRTAIVTGAASGIGAALARDLAARGCNLALVDVNAQGVADIARALGSNRQAITAHVCDLADRDAIAELTREITATHSAIDMLFNNAGAALGGEFAEVAEADFDWLMDVNFNAVVRMTRAFLPALIASDAGRLINVSSLYGIIAPAGQTAYAASKFAVRGFSAALRQELKETGVQVHTVHPGGVKTNIARNARINVSADPAEVEAGVKAAEALFITPPETAAATILKGVDRGKPRIIVGRDAQVVTFIERLIPSSATALITRLMGKQAR